MEAIDIPYIHNNILRFLLNWRKKYPGFSFSLRKSDLSKRLSLGYWFHGNDEYIAISFWTGSDWQGKVPNISFIITPITGECFLQFSVKDSEEKDQLIRSLFMKRFELDEINRALYCAPIKLYQGNGYLNELEKFLLIEKLEIDNIIQANKKIFETRQNPKNRIGFINVGEFLKNLERTQRFQKKKFSGNLPVGLLEIEIENFGLIKHLEIKDIPANAQWIFLTGENGTGKTNILKAMATAFTNASFKLGPRTHIKGNFSIGLTLQKQGIKSQRHRIKKK